MARGQKAEALRHAIEACRDPRTGRVTPGAVVEAARDPKNKVLHERFEWNLRKAAEAHWLDTARELIREVRIEIVYEEIKTIVPFYVSDPDAEKSSYIPTTSIEKGSATARRILDDELTRIEAAITRARGLSITFELASDFEAMLAAVAKVRAFVGRRAA